MITTIAWRNVWRNKRRSAILIAAIAFGIWAGLIMIGLMYGAAEQQVQSAIETRTAHIQIHAPEFLGHKDIARTIPDGDSLLAALRRMPQVKAAAARVVVAAMAASATTGRGVTVYGVTPGDEKQVSDVAQHVIEGTYFATDKRNPIVISARLADKLGVRLGQKIVITSQSATGDISAGAFRIVGIFKTVSSMFDDTTVFALRDDLSSTFALDGKVHEIVLILRNIVDIDAVAASLQTRYPALDVKTWEEISPEVALTMSSTQQMNEIFMGIILIALIFGITNTMLMGVLERMRELGMVIALGMRHRSVFLMILLETLFLSLAGGAAGIVLGAASVALLGRTGIDLSMASRGLEAFGFSQVMYPVVPLREYPVVVGLVVLTAIIAAIYPGLKAVRLSPVRAIRTY
jgi:putative ABC transport system permease protein